MRLEFQNQTDLDGCQVIRFTNESINIIDKVNMNITFIGGGNMASALINGLLQQGYAAKQLHVVEINAESREKIKNTFGVSASADLASGVMGSNVIVSS